MNVVQKLDKWHKTGVGHAVFAVIELVLAYIVGSRAIDTGSWWEYGLALFLLIGSLQNIFRIIIKK